MELQSSSNNQHIEVEKNVLDVYRKVSPSYIPIEKQIKHFEQTRLNFIHSLGLFPNAFANRSLVDIGGGTGESALYYAKWGAKVTIVEPNEHSVERAQSLFKENELPLNTIQDSLFNLKRDFIQKFDIVVCDGVVHHTYDPRRALGHLLSGAKKGALVIIGMCEANGFFKRHLQRKLIFSIAGDNEEKIVSTAKEYFSEHLERAAKFGMRSIETIIYDTYVNPQIQPTELRDICESFMSHNVQYLAANPTLNYFAQTIPWKNHWENRFNYSTHEKYYGFLEKIWKACGDTSEELVNAKQFSFSKFTTDVEEKCAQLDLIEKQIQQSPMNIDKIDLTPIQKGYLGVGEHNFLGVVS